MASNNRSEAVGRAEEAVDRTTGAPHDAPKYGGGDASTARLEEAQHREAGEAWAGPGVPATTDAQWKGLVMGSLVGGALGLLLFLPLALIPIGGSLTARLIICGIAGALAGGTAGALYAGGRLPELEGETVDADGRPSVGTTMRDPGTDERGR